MVAFGPFCRPLALAPAAAGDGDHHRQHRHDRDHDPAGHPQPLLAASRVRRGLRSSSSRRCRAASFCSLRDAMAWVRRGAELDDAPDEQDSDEDRGHPRREGEQRGEEPQPDSALRHRHPSA